MFPGAINASPFAWTVPQPPDAALPSRRNRSRRTRGRPGAGASCPRYRGSCCPLGWTYRFTPYGWLTALDGTQTVRGRSVKVDASFIDIVEESDTLVALMGDFEARYGRLALLADVVWSKIGADGGTVRTRTLAPGVTGALGMSLNLDIEMAIVEVGAAYEVAR
jgi:hypothetical protein